MRYVLGGIMTVIGVLSFLACAHGWDYGIAPLWIGGLISYLVLTPIGAILLSGRAFSQENGA